MLSLVLLLTEGRLKYIFWNHNQGGVTEKEGDGADHGSVVWSMRHFPDSMDTKHDGVTKQYQY